MLLQCRRENEFRGPLPAFLFLVILVCGDPVNAICVAYATTLFTGLLRFTRNDKCVDCVAVRNDRLWIAPRMTRGAGRRRGKLKQGD